MWERLFTKKGPGGQKTKAGQGQSILDFILVFIALALLAVGIVRIWVWFNANYASRQVAYQRSRLTSGKPQTPYDKPLDIGAAEPKGKYEPLDLTEEWVFKGLPSGTVSFSGRGGPAPDTETLCRDGGIDRFGDGVPSCLGAGDCGGDAESFNYDCACFVHCACEQNVKPARLAYEAQAQALEIQVENMRNQARGLRKAASKCDDPWELCWWGDWGATPRELRRAARQLEMQAFALHLQALDLLATSRELLNCCQRDNVVEQELCIKVITGVSCDEIVDGIIDGLKAEINEARNAIAEMRATIAQINAIVFQCGWNARTSCDTDCTTTCTDASGVFDAGCYYSACFPPCYDTRRNDCCKTQCCDGDSWGRACDTPTTGCDEDCQVPGVCPGCDKDHPHLCIKCGLTELASRLPADIAELQDQIAVLQRKINKLLTCCSLPLEDQLQCISETITTGE